LFVSGIPSPLILLHKVQAFGSTFTAAVGVIRENLAALDVEDRAQVIQAPAAMLLARYTDGIVFLDPPYPLVKEYDDALHALGAAPAPSLLVIVRHHSKFALADSHGALRRVRQRRQGDNTLSFYEPV
jgi:16S rRNA G966 N2-methylase RsmD